MAWFRGFPEEVPPLADAHTGELGVPPRLTASAEWCALPDETKGEKMGGGGKTAVAGNVTAAAHLLPPFPQYAAHHSASDDRNWRNLQRSKTYYHKTVGARKPTSCQRKSHAVIGKHVPLATAPRQECRAWWNGTSTGGCACRRVCGEKVWKGVRVSPRGKSHE